MFAFEIKTHAIQHTQKDQNFLQFWNMSHTPENKHQTITKLKMYRSMQKTLQG